MMPIRKLRSKIDATVTLLALAVVVLFGYVIYLQETAETYKEQIHSDSVLLNKLMAKDSLYSELIRVEDRDSVLVLTRSVDQTTGKPLTYWDLDSLYRYYRNQSEVQDIIIVHAKQIYQFNYGVTVKGDSIKLKFWKK